MKQIKTFEEYLLGNETKYEFEKMVDCNKINDIAKTVHLYADYVTDRAMKGGMKLLIEILKAYRDSEETKEDSEAYAKGVYVLNDFFKKVEHLSIETMQEKIYKQMQ